MPIDITSPEFTSGLKHFETKHDEFAKASPDFSPILDLLGSISDQLNVLATDIGILVTEKGTLVVPVSELDATEPSIDVPAFHGPEALIRDVRDSIRVLEQKVTEARALAERDLYTAFRDQVDHAEGVVESLWHLFGEEDNAVFGAPAKVEEDALNEAGQEI